MNGRATGAAGAADQAKRLVAALRCAAGCAVSDDRKAKAGALASGDRLALEARTGGALTGGGDASDADAIAVVLHEVCAREAAVVGAAAEGTREVAAGGAGRHNLSRRDAVGASVTEEGGAVADSIAGVAVVALCAAAAADAARAAVAATGAVAVGGLGGAARAVGESGRADALVGWHQGTGHRDLRRRRDKAAALAGGARGHGLTESLIVDAVACAIDVGAETGAALLRAEGRAAAGHIKAVHQRVAVVVDAVVAELLALRQAIAVGVETVGLTIAVIVEVVVAFELEAGGVRGAVGVGAVHQRVAVVVHVVGTVALTADGRARAVGIGAVNQRVAVVVVAVAAVLRGRWAATDRCTTAGRVGTVHQRVAVVVNAVVADLRREQRQARAGIEGPGALGRAPTEHKRGEAGGASRPKAARREAVADGGLIPKTRAGVEERARRKRRERPSVRDVVAGGVTAAGDRAGAFLAIDPAVAVVVDVVVAGLCSGARIGDGARVGGRVGLDVAARVGIVHASPERTDGTCRAVDLRHTGNQTEVTGRRRFADLRAHAGNTATKQRSSCVRQRVGLGVAARVGCDAGGIACTGRIIAIGETVLIVVEPIAAHLQRQHPAGGVTHAVHVGAVGHAVAVVIDSVGAELYEQHTAAGRSDAVIVLAVDEQVPIVIDAIAAVFHAYGLTAGNPRAVAVVAVGEPVAVVVEQVVATLRGRERDARKAEAEVRDIAHQRIAVDGGVRNLAVPSALGGAIGPDHVRGRGVVADDLHLDGRGELGPGRSKLEHRRGELVARNCHPVTHPDRDPDGVGHCAGRHRYLTLCHPSGSTNTAAHHDRCRRLLAGHRAVGVTLPGVVDAAKGSREGGKEATAAAAVHGRAADADNPLQAGADVDAAAAAAV